MFPLTNRRSTIAGFTLVETIVTMTIIGFVVIGVMPFFLQNTKYLYTSEQKLLINADIRDFTNEMVENAREANYFVLYQAAYTRVRTDDGVTVKRDFNSSGTVNAIDRMTAGQAGEFLVFVYYEDPFFDSRFYDGNANNNDITSVRVTRMVSYWAAPNRNIPGKTALYVMDTDSFKSSPSATSWSTPWSVTFPVTLTSSVTIESLLQPATLAYAQTSNARIVINDMRGLGPSGSYFVNYLNRSVLVRAKILHGNQAKRVTNTYNFTITPRG
ncbi:MAG: prepilin-type N-terminal cleavage/methylation domain-containing protein [Cephaloticoccus sp.]|nr:prepilin-type N-terminal cleavage/methylation domain-containing protein [Cephaloticoccus sp.]MCF7759946.1 prepilin-type N-terminal cleavage/methylation domain-containing protein [Cephaloticoccus sp.]